jgi:hypothetical protein
MTTSCASTSPEPSYQAAAMEASQRGDLKTAISLVQKEVARYSTPDECAGTTTRNCGTLALAYSSLAEYQILSGDMAAGESSFRSAKEALGRTDRANRASAAGIVYRDVSEAFWKAGDRPRAIAVFKEGRVAGGDSYLYMGSAAKAVADQEKAAPRPADDTVTPPAPLPAPARSADRS